ncbi:MAG: DUF983 domain-containing protein [Reichenbachiella sp.]|uniref:DUF983 domain-containing protein n=1 Tax=Reichenbachiella sp. TaxID=2184521 RepID=UPI002966B518|nr:DUF983 domain-containing protein [Reichenbachiella sp.]MDW3211807.1 DUF983 domain-containing protein [Reichenbachiella sp.]
MQKISSSEALLSCKCPRCREGNMFKHSLTEKWFSLEMHDKCPKCQQTYEPEPGFYFGAMFVNYAFSAAITLSTAFVLYHFFNNPDTWVYMTVVMGFVALLWPVMFKYSRSIFLHLFGGIRFNPKYAD